MNRKEELEKIICKTSEDRMKAERLIEEVVFLEEQMEELKKYPFIAINKKNPEQQRATPASKQYKELLQQYNNCLRLLFKLSGDLGGDVEEESPLRAWAKRREEGGSVC